jgi:uncharacterized protein YfiM (DUF2279 family)
VFVWAFSLGAQGFAQRDGKDSSAVSPRDCLRITTSGVALGMAGTFYALDKAWYAGYDRSAFHTFDDSGEWLQMDKAGHLFSAYTLGSWGHALLDRCATKPRMADLAGGSLGLLFLSGVEVLDGTSSGWGFSWSDMAANVGGAGLFIGQELAWGEQRLYLKLSAHGTSYAAQRPDLLGEGIAERTLKDYNGQTIWLSANLDRFAPDRGLPPWLNVAVGYGAEGMISAFPVELQEQGMGDGRYRQFYLSPDVDLTRIPTRSKVLRTVLFVLNGVKVPLPALEFRSTGKVVGHALYF